ncbi:long-chain fatty acid--CoA ligase [Carboxydochorda subterranea]|uniref:Long-chain fatty acid--CoA ligase n=1 Tax=Carboxydichorda subterranea TaxID=3109565 RepID=A0ABZ1BW36_9FIRM|nr:long-chain fatty acid--CoA ligase [Limnochorda sp. L945t]WRP16881.1 long-chain fatty acid--CoA ligase [Limnochorda sp. L945t]
MELDSGSRARPWLKHYPPEIPSHLEYPEINLAAWVQQSARRHPDRAATLYFGARLSYARLFEQVRRLAGGLRALGVRPGDRVAIILPNLPQTVIAYYAVLWLGGVVVMTNPLYTPRELRHQLADAEARVVVAFDQILPRVLEVASEVGLRHVVVTSAADYLPPPLRLLYPLKQAAQRRHQRRPHPAQHPVAPSRPPGLQVHAFTRLVRSQPLDGPHPVDAREDLALLQYTGGTTGTSKGVMLTHFNLAANCTQIQAWLYKLEGRPTTVLAALPFFHVYGLTTVLNFSVMTGSTMILTPRFSAAEVVRLIERHRPRLFPGVPTMYVAITQLPDIARRDLSSVEACISGAAPLPVAVQESFERLTGGRLVEGYGLTEASPVTHANPIWGARRTGSIGLPWPDTDARIVDPATGEPLPPGSVGELAVRGPQVMKGYWQRPEETAAVLRDGWLLTGDLAQMDDDGYFRIVDRKKDLIIAGGFNIYPREVEEVLYEHPAVREAAVVGVTDPYRGETVKAYVVLKEGHAVTAAELEAFCRERLAAYKVPRLFDFRDELPKTLVGKVLRRALREEAPPVQEAAASGREPPATAGGRPA